MAPKERKYFTSSVYDLIEIFSENKLNKNISTLYYKFLDVVEPPLLKLVLNYVNDNQSEAANILGLNRTTLRSKIKKYELDKKNLNNL